MVGTSRDTFLMDWVLRSVVSHRKNCKLNVSKNICGLEFGRFSVLYAFLKSGKK
jgi:hypothetical protein